MSGKYPKRWISGRSLALYQYLKSTTRSAPIEKPHGLQQSASVVDRKGIQDLGLFHFIPEEFGINFATYISCQILLSVNKSRLWKSPPNLSMLWMGVTPKVKMHRSLMVSHLFVNVGLSRLSCFFLKGSNLSEHCNYRLRWCWANNTFLSHLQAAHSKNSLITIKP